MPWTLVMLTTLVVSKAVAADNCFWRSNNQIHAMGSGWFACNNTQVIDGGAQLCCIQGSQCGQDSICLQNVSYYVGGCTDGSYGDRVCRTSCTSVGATWIQWNSNTQAWECCGSSGCDGSPPTETFSAVARASWSPVKTAPQSSSAALTTGSTTSASVVSTTSASINSTSTTTPASVNSTEPDGDTDMSGGTNLSTGAQAGIGVACGLFGLAAVLALGLVLIRRHKKHRAAAERQRQEQEHRQADPASSAPPMAIKYAPLDPLSSAQPHGIVPQPKPELPADTTARVELEGHSDGVPK